MNGSVVVQKEKDLVRLKERGYSHPTSYPFHIQSLFQIEQSLEAPYRRREKGNIQEFSHPPSYSSGNTSHSK